MTGSVLASPDICLKSWVKEFCIVLFKIECGEYITLCVVCWNLFILFAGKVFVGCCWAAFEASDVEEKVELYCWMAESHTPKIGFKADLVNRVGGNAVGWINWVGGNAAGWVTAIASACPTALPPFTVVWYLFSLFKVNNN